MSQELPDGILPASKYGLIRDIIDTYGSVNGHFMTRHTIDSPIVHSLDLQEGYIKDTIIDTAFEPNGQIKTIRRLLPNE